MGGGAPRARAAQTPRAQHPARQVPLKGGRASAHRAVRPSHNRGRLWPTTLAPNAGSVTTMAAVGIAAGERYRPGGRCRRARGGRYLSLAPGSSRQPLDSVTVGIFYDNSRSSAPCRTGTIQDGCLAFPPAPRGAASPDQPLGRPSKAFPQSNVAGAVESASLNRRVSSALGAAGLLAERVGRHSVSPSIY